MIYFLDYIGAPKDLILISELFPSFSGGLLIFLSSLVPILLYGAMRRRKEYVFMNRFILVIAGVAYTGMYVATSYYIDEVFVNLEHSYNLHHHGLFSFSPERLILGTVELAYYLVLTPFAWSRTSLIHADYFFGFLIGFFHLVILWRLLVTRNVDLKLLMLLLFTVNISLMRIFSNGFGNSLVSLIFLLCLNYELAGKTPKALFAASLLPLVRPDAILYSASVFFVAYLRDRKIAWQPVVLTVLSLAAYSAIVQWQYGEWLPTPIRFKSFTLCLLPHITANDLHRILIFLAQPMHAIFLLAGVYAIFFARYGERKIQWHFVPLTGIFVFYSLAAYNPTIDGRYYAGFELFLSIFPLLYLDRAGADILGSDPPGEKLRFSRSNAAGLLLLFVAVIAIGVAGLLDLRDRNSKHRPAESVDGYGVGGQLVDQILPQGWSIAATEMNTFGYMNDRELIDLWGYTNSAIARSDRYSAFWKIRIHPDLFLSLKPDIFWHRTAREGSRLLGDHFEGDDLEKLLLESPNINRQLNQLGDMGDVVKHYDIIVFRTQGWITTFLVRKDQTESLLKTLYAEDYRLIHSRAIHTERFMKRDLSLPPHEFRCSGLNF